MPDQIRIPMILTLANTMLGICSDTSPTQAIQSKFIGEYFRIGTALAVLRNARLQYCHPAKLAARKHHNL